MTNRPVVTQDRSESILQEPPSRIIIYFFFISRTLMKIGMKMFNDIIH